MPDALIVVAPGLTKFECPVCLVPKTILGYVDRKTMRRSWECRMCRRDRVKGRPIPQNMDAGEWLPGRSDGYAVMQLDLKRKCRKRGRKHG